MPRAVLRAEVDCSCFLKEERDALLRSTNLPAIPNLSSLPSHQHPTYQFLRNDGDHDDGTQRRSATKLDLELVCTSGLGFTELAGSRTGWTRILDPRKRRRRDSA